MTYIQISELIKEKYLIPLENYKIKTLKDVESFHDELIKVRVAIRFDVEIGMDVMPHYRGEQNYGWDILPGIFRPPFSSDIDLKKAREIEKNGAKIFRKKVIENYNEEIGNKIARENAREKVWLLEGYLLKQKLYEVSL